MLALFILNATTYHLNTNINLVCCIAECGTTVFVLSIVCHMHLVSIQINLLFVNVLCSHDPIVCYMFTLLVVTVKPYSVVSPTGW